MKSRPVPKRRSTLPVSFHHETRSRGSSNNSGSRKRPDKKRIPKSTATKPKESIEDEKKRIAQEWKTITAEKKWIEEEKQKIKKEWAKINQEKRKLGIS